MELAGEYDKAKRKEKHYRLFKRLILTDLEYAVINFVKENDYSNILTYMLNTASIDPKKGLLNEYHTLFNDVFAYCDEDTTYSTFLHRFLSEWQTEVIKLGNRKNILNRIKEYDKNESI